MGKALSKLGGSRRKELLARWKDGPDSVWKFEVSSLWYRNLSVVAIQFNDVNFFPLAIIYGAFHTQERLESLLLICQETKVPMFLQKNSQLQSYFMKGWLQSYLSSMIYLFYSNNGSYSTCDQIKTVENG